MKGYALGVLDDLRARRLWPVALLLAIALVGVPVTMLKPAEKAAPLPSAESSAAAPDGLPSPEEALANDKPLVSLAVLNTPSDLESFESKNPFRPLESLYDGLPAGVSPGSLVDRAAQAAVSDGDPGGSTGGGGESPSDGGGSPGSAAPPGPSTPPGDPLPDPDPDPEPKPQPIRQFTYAVDLTFDGPGPARSYRNLPRLSMLPDQREPLLVFLGVGASGNNAVFLVDSTLHAQGGEGSCNPRPSECATLSIEPGEEQVFVDDQDRSYVIQIDQIRPLPLKAGAPEGTSVPDAGAEAGAGTASAGSRRRFVVPVLADLLVTGVQP